MYEHWQYVEVVREHIGSNPVVVTTKILMNGMFYANSSSCIDSHQSVEEPETNCILNYMKVGSV